jgi:hypothetical protein
MMQISHANSNNKGPKTITIKDQVITYKTEELDLAKCEVTDEDIEGLKHFTNIKSIILS